ncbi:hypothetical protein B0J13DRAFT_87281 [Dactylonectria estremocensis]|uniref:Uncharacterized protein n=1 Tax=Dactylonectria estremocensis TaxID=1079267 RepID=A0A9P9ECK6_9HYPO|nr:hypothetical protein B0J13DRAFT_87281 [Dactylonectria estremocensis]
MGDEEIETERYRDTETSQNTPTAKKQLQIPHRIASSRHYLSLDSFVSRNLRRNWVSFLSHALAFGPPGPALFCLWLLVISSLKRPVSPRYSLTRLEVLCSAQFGDSCFVITRETRLACSVLSSRFCVLGSPSSCLRSLVFLSAGLHIGLHNWPPTSGLHLRFSVIATVSLSLSLSSSSSSSGAYMSTVSGAYRAGGCTPHHTPTHTLTLYRISHPSRLSPPGCPPRLWDSPWRDIPAKHRCVDTSFDQAR